MKRISTLRTLCLVVFLAPLASFSQQYFPDGTLWSEMNWGWGGLPINTHMEICGETTINDTVYQNVNQIPDIEQEFQSITTRMIRQDGQRVYIRLGSGEGLLYDFSLEAGEMVTVQSDDFLWANLEVESTETIMLDGFETKKMTLTGGSNDTEIWYEGIGCDRGFLNSGISQITVSDYDPWLCCVKLEGESVEVGDFDECVCDLPYDSYCPDSPTNFQNPEAPSFACFPNPTNCMVNLILPPNFNTGQLTVFDSAGRRVLDQRIGSQENTSLQIPGADGIYFVQIQNQDGHRETVKVLKNSGTNSSSFDVDQGE